MTDTPEILARYTPRPVPQAGIFLCLVLFAVTAAIVLLTTDPADVNASLAGRVAVWAVIVICPIFAVDTLVRLVRRTPTLVATPEGLVMRTIFGFTPPLPWAEIEAIGPVVMGKKAYLAIYLKAPTASLARLGIAARTMLVRTHAEGVPNILLRPINLGVSPVEAGRELDAIRRQFSGG